MWGCPKFVYEALNRTTTKWIALKWTMWSQTKAFIAKASCDMCALLAYYTVWSDHSLPTFWDNMLVPSSRTKKSERENRAQLK
jgi:hypothetical protein